MPSLRFSGFVLPLLLLTVIAVPAGCGRSKGEDSSGRAAWHPLPVHYAGGFLLDTAAGIVRAQVVNPWQGDKKERFTYLIIRDNKRDQRPQAAVVVHAPVRRVVCTSTTHVAFLSALGRSSSIVGISGRDYICDSTLRRRIAAGGVKDIGYDRNMNYELIVQLRPDVVFLYGIGPAVKGTAARLASLNIPAVIVGDYLERTPLGRAEWIRFFGAFFGMTGGPARFADSLAARYDSLQQQVRDTARRPLVMTGLPWNEVWYVPGNGSLTAAFIRDAGGRYVWDNIASGDAVPRDIEKVFRKAGDADIWINCGTASSLQEITATDERLGLFRPVKTGRVYNNDARLNETGGNDYWESGVVHPDIILEDLQKIFGGNGERGLNYYRKLK